MKELGALILSWMIAIWVCLILSGCGSVPIAGLATSAMGLLRGGGGGGGGGVNLNVNIATKQTTVTCNCATCPARAIALTAK